MWADHSASMFYTAQEMRYDTGILVYWYTIPSISWNVRLLLCLKIIKNSACYKNELLKTTQTIAWTSLNVHAHTIQVEFEGAVPLINFNEYDGTLNA